LKFEPDAVIGQKGVLCKGLKEGQSEEAVESTTLNKAVLSYDRPGIKDGKKWLQIQHLKYFRIISDHGVISLPGVLNNLKRNMK
jgi:hypothetical protein